MMDGVNPNVVEPLAQFGLAGLMAALWIKERLVSRQRENELSEAHRRLMRDKRELGVLMKLVRRNTRAIERFAAAQRRLASMLERERGGPGHD